ncbi:MAG: hypothetical protein CML68_19005 [Rhodobacteraceae bacterium]|nr:hypothetical protein [Paracoccaceae bacterium]
MYKFIITIICQPGTRDKILARAPEGQAATRAEPGCIANDFFTCTDDPDKLVFVETWADEAAYAFHMEQQHTKDFIAFHEQFHRSLTFETINIAADAATTAPAQAASGSTK